MKDVRVKCCTEGGCPFAFTDQSEYLQAGSCLPSPHDIVAMRVNHGKTWACHSDPKKPCLGAIKYLKNSGLPYKVIDKVLQTEKTDWELYIEGSSEIRLTFQQEG